MAFDKKDANAIITQGLFSGSWGAQIVINDDEKYIRLLSQGLLDTAPNPGDNGSQSGGLNDVGTSTTL